MKWKYKNLWVGNKLWVNLLDRNKGPDTSPLKIDYYPRNSLRTSTIIENVGNSSMWFNGLCFSSNYNFNDLNVALKLCDINQPRASRTNTQRVPSFL